MSILTRYVVREHAGPLIFALTALTSLLMLQYVARQLANLAGKGLPWTVIGKFFVLSLPFTIAMTMPMAVLVATLYAFGRMAAEQEVTAFKANGVRVRTLMAPVLVSAFLLSIGMVLFNDQVLPRSNHILRVLQSDIARTRPAFFLRDQVLNTINDQFVMRIARSDPNTGRLWDVVIYDLTKPLERKTIYADSGRISLAPNERDLQLELFDGHVQELVRGDAKRLQRTFFREQNVRVKGVNQGLELSGSDNYKGDRELSICALHDRYMAQGVEYQRVRKDYMAFSSRSEVAHQVRTKMREPPSRQVLATMYCGAVESITSLFGTKTAHAADLPDKQSAAVPASQATPDVAMQDTVVPLAPIPPQAMPGPNPGMLPQPGAADTPPMDSMFVAGAFMSTTNQLATAQMELDQLAVEIHKKFALSFACLVFVLFGPPIALRFPRGGVGITIGVSIVVFGLYYVCLMGGEALADNGHLPPFLAMWIANAVFGTIGIVLLWRIEQTTDTSRGGGIAEWWADRRARRAMQRAEQASRTGIVTAPSPGVR